MTLGALSWPVLLAIVGVASVIVIGLHLLRLRRRKVVVPHLAIFEEAIGSAATAKRVDWLRRILALLLSLLIAGALSLSLGEPELPRNDKGEIRILVIDQSLSMEARDETGRSRRDRALEEAARWIESKDENDSMAILAADHMPLILSPLSKDRDALKSSLRQSTKGWGEAALRETLMLGRDLIEEAQRRAPAPHQALEMVVLTDEPMEEIVEEVFGNTAMQESAENSSNETDEAGALLIRILPIQFAGGRDNLAIAELAARRLPSDPTRVRTLAHIENHGPSDRKARLELSSESGPLESLEIRLPPHSSDVFFFDDLPLTEGRIDASLHLEDAASEALFEDNWASALVAPRERVRVHLISRGNLYLEAALLLDPSFELTMSGEGDPFPERGIDLYVLDSVAPKLPPRVPALIFIDPRMSEGDAPELGPLLGELLDRPRIRTEREEDPIVRGARLYETNIKEARSIRLLRGERGLAHSGKDALLSLVERDERRMLVFGFRIEESDLPLRAAFPLILMRGADALLGRTAEYRPPHRQFEPIELESGGKELSLHRPTVASLPDHRDADASHREGNAPERLLSVGGYARFIPMAQGVYRVEGEGFEAEFVVARSALDESRIAREETLSGSLSESATAHAPSANPPHLRTLFMRLPLLTLLLSFALVLLVLESLFYHRRWIE